MDVIGQIGADPGAQWGSGETSTADHTLAGSRPCRQATRTAPGAFDPSAEWLGLPIDTFDGLGQHTVDQTPEGPNRLPGGRS